VDTRAPSTRWRRASPACPSGSSASGALVGTINVTGVSQRLDEGARRRAVEHVREVVEDIEAALQEGRRAAA
jgi:hypothetical protein